MTNQNSNVMQRQIALQKAIAKIPNDYEKEVKFNALKERLKKIVRENAELDANEIERKNAKDKYEDEPRLYQMAAEPTYADDNNRCFNINYIMMKINDECDELHVDKMFPAACENYSYNQVAIAAKEYVENIRTIDELNQENEKHQQIHKNLPRKNTKEKSERDTDEIINDIVDEINKQNNQDQKE